jgi:hypothetical protein
MYRQNQRGETQRHCLQWKRMVVRFGLRADCAAA